MEPFLERSGTYVYRSFHYTAPVPEMPFIQLAVTNSAPTVAKYCFEPHKYSTEQSRMSVFMENFSLCSAISCLPINFKAIEDKDSLLFFIIF